MAKITLKIDYQSLLGFALWISQNCEIGDAKDGWFIYQNKEWLTSDECLELYKVERLKKDDK